MRSVIDISGQRFGKLFVMGESIKRYKNGASLWHCECQCGNQVKVSGYYLRNGLRRSCGCQWRPHDEKGISALKYLLEINSKWDHIKQCQEWTGDKDRKGFGRIHITKKTRKHVHDISWMIHEGRIPKGSKVIQSCGNPLCFRMEHLGLIKN